MESSSTLVNSRILELELAIQNALRHLNSDSVQNNLAISHPELYSRVVDAIVVLERGV